MNVCKVYSWERLTEINLIQTSQVNLRVDEGYRTVVWDYVVAKQIEVRPSMIVLQFGLIENPLSTDPSLSSLFFDLFGIIAGIFTWLTLRILTSFCYTINF